MKIYYDTVLTQWQNDLDPNAEYEVKMDDFDPNYSTKECCFSKPTGHGQAIEVTFVVKSEEPNRVTPEALPFQVAYRRWDRTHGLAEETIMADCATIFVAYAVAEACVQRLEKEWQKIEAEMEAHFAAEPEDSFRSVPPEV